MPALLLLLLNCCPTVLGSIARFPFCMGLQRPGMPWPVASPTAIQASTPPTHKSLLLHQPTDRRLTLFGVHAFKVGWKLQKQSEIVVGNIS
jgi:hypothetical protein